MKPEKQKIVVFGNRHGNGVWLKDETIKSYYHCSLCDHLHKRASQGPLPDLCPTCGAKMIKGHAAAMFRNLHRLLEQEANKSENE